MASAADRVGVYFRGRTMRRSGPTGTVGPAQGYTFLYYVKQYFDLLLVNMRRPGLTDFPGGGDISRPRLVGLDKVPCNLYGGDQPGAMRPATGRRFEETGYFLEYSNGRDAMVTFNGMCRAPSVFKAETVFV